MVSERDYECEYEPVDVDRVWRWRAVVRLRRRAVVKDRRGDVVGACEVSERVLCGEGRMGMGQWEGNGAVRYSSASP